MIPARRQPLPIGIRRLPNKRGDLRLDVRLHRVTAIGRSKQRSPTCIDLAIPCQGNRESRAELTTIVGLPLFEPGLKVAATNFVTTEDLTARKQWLTRTRAETMGFVESERSTRTSPLELQIKRALGGKQISVCNRSRQECGLQKRVRCVYRI